MKLKNMIEAHLIEIGEKKLNAIQMQKILYERDANGECVSIVFENLSQEDKKLEIAAMYDSTFKDEMKIVLTKLINDLHPTTTKEVIDLFEYEPSYLELLGSVKIVSEEKRIERLMRGQTMFVILFQIISFISLLLGITTKSVAFAFFSVVAIIISAGMTVSFLMYSSKLKQIRTKGEEYEKTI